MTVFSATSIFVVICLAGVALAASPPNDQEFRCTPGSQFQRECNTCTCSDNGKAATCTLKACLRKREAPKGIPGQEGYCNPGESFMDDCNSCTCTSDGKNAYCTLMACYHPTEIQNRLTRSAPAPNTPGYTCNPGETFKYQCNTCRCNSLGTRAACTFAACPPGSYRRRRQATAAPNTPGFTCTPGENFKYQCNTCVCDSTGTKAGCTFRACPPGSYRRRRQAAECQTGETKQDECGNNCNCIQGSWACTRKACPKTKREDPVEKEFNTASCIPNDKFNIDCNTCYCNNDGSGYSCTEKSCVPAPSIQRPEEGTSMSQTLAFVD